MAHADEQAYQEMCSILSTFITNISDSCQDINSAAADCVDNMDEDPVSSAAASKLQKCTQQILSTVPTAQAIIQALQQEIERIRNTAAQAAASMDD